MLCTLATHHCYIDPLAFASFPLSPPPLHVISPCAISPPNERTYGFRKNVAFFPGCGREKEKKKSAP